MKSSLEASPTQWLTRKLFTSCRRKTRGDAFVASSRVSVQPLASWRFVRRCFNVWRAFPADVERTAALNTDCATVDQRPGDHYRRACCFVKLHRRQFEEPHSIAQRFIGVVWESGSVHEVFRRSEMPSGRVTARVKNGTEGWCKTEMWSIFHVIFKRLDVLPILWII